VKYILIDGNSWRVKIRIGFDTIQQYFNFNTCGGKKKALEQAVLWRDGTLEKYDLLDRLLYKKSPDYFKHRPAAPIIGVYMSYNSVTDKWNWSTRYSIDEKEVKRHFSCNKYGSKIAFLKACEVRYAHAGKLRIVNKSLMPCLPKVPYKIVHSSS